MSNEWTLATAFEDPGIEFENRSLWGGKAERPGGIPQASVVSHF
jgi:hypothetical protein